jgi:hypothetical protein
MKRPVQADNLIKIGALREEDHAPEEIHSHVALAEGYLRVAKITDLPVTVRYLNAYDGVHQVATAALRALNLRTSDRAGARDKTIQALAWSLNARSELLPVLTQSNITRGHIVYDPTDGTAVSAGELSALVGALEEILKSARSLLASESDQAGSRKKNKGSPLK